MKLRNRKLALVSSIALALGVMVSGVTASAKSSGTMSEQAAEANRESRILTSFNMNRHLRAYDLSVDVDGSKAVLSGKVEEGVAKDLAEQIAQGVDGIKQVDNRIVVDPGYVHAKREGNERGFGETVDDATITASVKSKLLWNSHTDGLDIHVETKNNQVTLTGNANSSTEKDLAGRITRDTGGVIGVKNQIAVNGKTGNATTVKTGNDRSDQKVSDSWITAKVKSSLMFTRSVEAFDFTVTTVDGAVSLNGIVDNAGDRDRAVQVATDIRGVRKVDASGVKFQ